MSAPPPSPPRTEPRESPSRTPPAPSPPSASPAPGNQHGGYRTGSIINPRRGLAIVHDFDDTAQPTQRFHPTPLTSPRPVGPGHLARSFTNPFAWPPPRFPSPVTDDSPDLGATPTAPTPEPSTSQAGRFSPQLEPNQHARPAWHSHQTRWPSLVADVGERTEEARELPPRHRPAEARRLRRSQATRTVAPRGPAIVHREPEVGDTDEDTSDAVRPEKQKKRSKMRRLEDKIVKRLEKMHLLRKRKDKDGESGARRGATGV